MTYATSANVSIYYETFGEATSPALLMVNGLGAQCINFDVELCQLFVDRGFFVIRFDNRDVGLSTQFDEFTPSFIDVVTALREGRVPSVPYRLSDMANDAVTVLDALHIERAHVMGTSLGGMIVQQMAIDHPNRLLSMTSIMSTTGDTDVGHPSPAVAVLFYGARSTERATVIANRVELDRLCGSPDAFDAARVARRSATAFDRSFSPLGVARQLCAVTASGSRSTALRNVTVPTLVLHGDHDGLINISGGIRTAECIPGARFVALEGMGHDFPPAYWEQLTTLISTHAFASV